MSDGEYDMIDAENEKPYWDEYERKMSDPIPGNNEYDYLHINWQDNSGRQHTYASRRPKPEAQQIRDEAGEGVNPAEYTWQPSNDA